MRHCGTHRRGVLVSGLSAAHSATSTFPNPPRYEPDQLAAIHLDEIEKRLQPATPATWVIAIILTLAAAAWLTSAVTRSHHTSVMPPDPVRSSGPQ